MGTDKSDGNWICVQPGPQAAWAGSHPHVFEIVFNLDAVPVAADLRITTLDAVSAPDPRIRISCNSEPAGELTLPGGLWLMPPNAGRVHNRPYDLLATIPGELLKTGENRIALALAEGDWVAYQGIRLEARATPSPATRLIRATANPAQADRSGPVLQQYIVLDLLNNGSNRRVPVTVDGRDFSATLKPGRQTRVVKIPTDEKGRVVEVSVDGETTELALAPVMPSPRPESPKPAIGAEPLGNVPAEATVLHDGWRLQSSALVEADGATVSQTGFDDSSWFATSVPSSVLSALVRHGVYPDPYDGMNNLLIPDAHPGYSRRHDLDRFSHLPDASNPWQKPWWFRKTFVGTKAQGSGTTWLNLDGINYRADVWLNGTKIADAKDVVGMFRRFRFPISTLIRPDETNVLAIAVHPLDHPGDPVHERQFGANKGHGPDGGDAAITLDVTHSFVVVWDWNEPTRDRNLGLWQHVWLETTGPVAVRNPALRSDFDAAVTNDTRLTLRFRVDNPGPVARQVPLTIEISPENFKGKNLSMHTTVTVPPGMDREFVLTPKEVHGLVLNNPHLWWPRNYGEQPLYRVSVTACDEAGKPSSTATALAGIRQIGTFVLPSGGRAFTVNGRIIRMTGGHFVPDSSMNWDAQRYRDEARLMAEGNHSIVRINGCGIIPPDVFLDACDREGLLVWMDLARTSVSDSDRFDKSRDRGPAVPDTGVYLANMEDSIVRIRSHPSLLLYCGCNEQPAAGDGPRLVQDELLPRLDPGALYFSNSGDKKSPWAKEEHHWTSFGPYNLVPLTEYFEKYQKDTNFVCKDEIGLQSLPPINSVMSFIPDADSRDGKILTEGMGYHEAFWKEATPAHAVFRAIGRPATLNDYLWMGQVINAQHYRAIFDAANRARPRNAGTHVWKINAAWGSWMWQIYDWYLRPNAGYWTMKAACRPLNCAYSLPDRGLQVVSTLEKPFNGTLRARLMDSAMNTAWQTNIPVAVPADSTLAVGVVPDAIASGPLHWMRLELLNASAKNVAQNTYWQSGTSGWQGAGLADLPVVNVSAKVLSRKSLGIEDELRVAVTASRTNTAPAFLCQLEVIDGPLGAEVLPSFWDDNALVLLPGETRELTVRFRRALLTREPHLMVEGWNIRPRCFAVADNQEVKLEATLIGPQPAGEGKFLFTLTPTVESARYVTWPIELEVNGRRTTVRFATHGLEPANATIMSK